MTIQFGGLATGMDTNSIIDKLMSLERMPIARLEADKTWMNNRLSAFSELDKKMHSFLDSIKNLGDADSLQKRAVKLSTEDYLSASVSPEAMAGTSYQVEVRSLAQVQKSVSQAGFTSKESSSFATGTLAITVGGTSHSIDITDENNSLEGIMQAINDADIGVKAAIINDGSEDPYRLVLTGENVATDFSLDDSGLNSGTGTDNLGVFEAPGGTTNPPVQDATRAHLFIDGIEIYGDSNTLTEAIPGVTLDLVQAKTGETTNINISLDKNAIKSNIEKFAKGYNEVISFITGQSVIEEKGGGVLSGDSGINSIKRHLQNMLTTPFANSGVLDTLSQLGFETQKNGTLTVNNDVLSKAIDENLESVTTLLSGEDGKDGLAKQFQDYLESMTSSTTGMLQGRKTSINSNIKRIDNRIETMETRLTQREKTLRSQFTAMEQLVSGFNAQSSYLSQQMTVISNIMNYGNKR
jgi:flagellar hook-associated protein 2